MSRLLQRVHQVNTGERCTRHCRMDIACTASHVIGPQRQGGLWDDVFLLVNVSLLSDTKLSPSSFCDTLIECCRPTARVWHLCSTLCSDTKLPCCQPSSLIGSRSLQRPPTLGLLGQQYTKAILSTAFRRCSVGHLLLGL